MQARAADIPTTYSKHMEMTLPGAEQPGDRARADAIVAAARQVMAQYPTVEAALRAADAILKKDAELIWIEDRERSLILPADQVRLRASSSRSAPDAR